MDKQKQRQQEQNKSIEYFDIFAGILAALGWYKPLFLIYLPLLVIMAKKKGIFVISMILTVGILNVQFFFDPSLLPQFFAKIRNGYTLVGANTYYQSEICNLIWRNGFSPPRQQISLFPAFLLYLRQFTEKYDWWNQKKNLLSGIYLSFALIYFILGSILFHAGF